MNLPAIAIRRYVLAWMLSAVLILFGFISAQRIGVDRYPEIEFPMISITTNLPGANPEIIDASLTNLIETAVNGVPGIEHIQSDSVPGASVIRIIFNLNKDVDIAFNEVQAKVNQIIRYLPDEAETPLVAKVEFGAVPILWLVLQGDRTLQQLNQYARKVIKKRLENIDGVGEVRIGGERKRTIRINLDIERMNKYGLTIQDLIQSFQTEHIQMPGGFLVSQQTEFLLKLDLEFHRIDALKKMIVAYRGGFPIRIQDIARVEDGLDDARRIARFDGQPAVGLGIVKVSGANAVNVIESVKQRLKTDILPQLPPGMHLSIATDDSELILELVNALKEHLWLGTVLTALVVWLFLKNMRATLIIAVAIPVSLLGAVAVMYFSGYTFNTMTLLGLLLLIGVVVDDAIVVLEAIYRHREQQAEAKQAALQGSQEVIFAVIVSSLTLVAIFAPVIFMEGVIGRFFRSFAVVVTFGVLTSLFVSLTLTPALSARHLQKNKPGRIALYLERFFAFIEHRYADLLHIVLRYPWTSLILASMVVYSSQFFFNQIGKGFLPQEDEGKFLISFKTPLGSNLNYTVERLNQIESVLAAEAGIADYFSTIGTGQTGRVNQGEIFVRLKPRQHRDHMYQIIERLRKKMAHIPGVQAFPAPIPPMGGERGEPLQFVLLGPDIASVAQWSQRLKKRLDQYPELGRVDLDLQLNLPQLNFKIDRIRAADLGLNTHLIGSAINGLVGGWNIAKYNELPGDGERYDIRIKADQTDFQSIADLSKIYLRGRQGQLIRLDTIVQVKPQVGPAVITRFDLMYSGRFFSTPTIALGDAVKIVQQVAQSILPPGYQVKMVGRAEEFAKTAYYMLFAFITAIILVYMVLASQFNSFIQPLIIMVSLPLAVVGGVAALWWMNMGLNIFSMIGLVLLMGLVAKNSILLIDLTNQKRAQGMIIQKALLTACPIRLRPVLMTSLTVIITMLPAAIGIGAGTETNGPLAVAVIGGMISSTLLTLLIMPAVYLLVERGLNRIKSRFNKGRIA